MKRSYHLSIFIFDFRLRIKECTVICCIAFHCWAGSGPSGFWLLAQPKILNQPNPRHFLGWVRHEPASAQAAAPNKTPNSINPLNPSAQWRSMDASSSSSASEQIPRPLYTFGVPWPELNEGVSYTDLIKSVDSGNSPLLASSWFWSFTVTSNLLP